MNNFDKMINSLLQNLEEQMVAGGVGSAFGSPQIPIGDTGGSFGNVDSYNTGSTVRGSPLHRGYQKRKSPETFSRKSKKRK